MTYETSSFCSSDYAGFHTKDYSFYYGYERTIGDSWAFTASDSDGKEIFCQPIDQNKVNYDCNRGLLAGLAYFLDNLRTRDTE